MHTDITRERSKPGAINDNVDKFVIECIPIPLFKQFTIIILSMHDLF